MIAVIFSMEKMLSVDCIKYIPTIVEMAIVYTKDVIDNAHLFLTPIQPAISKTDINAKNPQAIGNTTVPDKASIGIKTIIATIAVIILVFISNASVSAISFIKCFNHTINPSVVRSGHKVSVKKSSA